MRIIIDNANEKQYRLHIGVSDSAGTQYSTSLWWGGELSHQANHGCFAPLRGAFFLSRAATATAATTTDADDGYPAGFTQENNGRTAQQNSSRSETRGQKQSGKNRWEQRIRKKIA
ncbi:hypothetical protein GJQ55_01980 [Venatoribacter cucullus]|uniref:Uncharacterized protein n=1 Tax=Venatoribacter cucullus TaxID=2661630 RepID=A0A9X7UWG0_9GAMM|nr:hypothetical protein [Venatoribacter cucullus]QQD23318.1 hypothetical protein GJQ55_01980 [Venatoribacter cucullus]